MHCRAICKNDLFAEQAYYYLLALWNGEHITRIFSTGRFKETSDIRIANESFEVEKQQFKELFKSKTIFF